MRVSQGPPSEPKNKNKLWKTPHPGLKNIDFSQKNFLKSLSGHSVWPVKKCAAVISLNGAVGDGERPARHRTGNRPCHMLMLTTQGYLKAVLREYCVNDQNVT